MLFRRVVVAEPGPAPRRLRGSRRSRGIPSATSRTEGDAVLARATVPGVTVRGLRGAERQRLGDDLIVGGPARGHTGLGRGFGGYPGLAAVGTLAWPGRSSPAR